MLSMKRVGHSSHELVEEDQAKDPENALKNFLLMQAVAWQLLSIAVGCGEMDQKEYH